jgi:hypothetical protein
MRYLKALCFALPWVVVLWGVHHMMYGWNESSWEYIYLGPSFVQAACVLCIFELLWSQEMLREHLERKSKK